VAWRDSPLIWLVVVLVGLEQPIPSRSDDSCWRRRKSIGRARGSLTGQFDCAWISSPVEWVRQTYVMR